MQSTISQETTKELTEEEREKQERLEKLIQEMDYPHFSDRYLRTFLHFFKKGMKKDEVNILKWGFKLGEITVKPYEDFEGDDFYRLLLSHFLYYMPDRAGRFNNNCTEAKVLVDLFLELAWTMPPEMFKNSNIKFYFLSLYDVFYKKKAFKAFFSLQNLIICAYDLVKTKEDKVLSLLKSINHDFFQSVREYVNKYVKQKYTSLGKIQVKSQEEGKQFDKVEKEHLLIKTKYEQINLFGEFEEFVNTFKYKWYSLFVIQDKDYFDQLSRLNKQSETSLSFSLLRTSYQLHLFKTSVDPLNQKSSVIECDIAYKELIKCLLLEVDDYDYGTRISEIVHNKNNILLFIKILQSEAVLSYYSTKVNEKDLFSGYLNLMKEINASLYEQWIEFIDKTLFILPLSEKKKGITYDFLRVGINSKYITITYDESNPTESDLLLTSYVLFTLLHESNHFCRRYVQQGKKEKDIRTPREEGDGGEHFFKYLFGSEKIPRIDITQAGYLLTFDYWTNISKLRGIFEKKDETISSIKYMSTQKNKKNHSCVVRLDDKPSD